MKRLFLLSLLIAGPLVAMEQQNNNNNSVDKAIVWTQRTLLGISSLTLQNNTGALEELFAKSKTGAAVKPEHLNTLRQAGLIPNNTLAIPNEIRWIVNKMEQMREQSQQAQQHQTNSK
jgi:hypothetical protein